MKKTITSRVLCAVLAGVFAFALLPTGAVYGEARNPYYEITPHDILPTVKPEG